MDILSTVLGVVLGLVGSIASGFSSWLDRAPTNNSVLLIVGVGIWLACWALRGDIETRIGRLRDLIIEIEDKKRGNWP
jgi:hypothetical protein